MDSVCVILDCQPAYLAGEHASRSLLTLPLGCGTVLSGLADAARRAGCADVRVLPLFETSDDHERRLIRSASAGTTMASADVMTALVRAYEPSDRVLILDPRYWPADGLDLAGILRDRSDSRWAVHGVATGWTPDGTHEQVHCDENGQVTRIFRYYQDVTCCRIDAITHSLIPLASSLEGVCFTSLAELRSLLSSRGVLSRDVPASAGIIDLTQSRGLLTLNEQWTIQAATQDPRDEYRRPRPGMLVGPHSRIHPSVNVVPPVIIQGDVTIEEEVSIVGPSVIGRGSTLGRAALIAQSVLADGTTVPPGHVLRHQVARNTGAPKGTAPGGGDDPKTPNFEPIDSHVLRQAADASLLRRIPGKRSLYTSLKLAMDVVVAGVSLVLLSPLFALTAIAVKLDSKGPVFFGHAREGKDGKVFSCLKFRTMCEDAHQRQRQLYAENSVDGPQFKMDHDPRITRVGAWLRATNIDELPQLINVLLGQMSLVGPRPSPFRENQICVPWRRARLSVRPGITGLWQICRDQRVDGDFHQWITYDILYVRHLSPWLDLKVLLATVLTLGGLWQVPRAWLIHDRARTEPDPLGFEPTGPSRASTAG